MPHTLLRIELPEADGCSADPECDRCGTPAPYFSGPLTAWQDGARSFMLVCQDCKHTLKREEG